MTPSGTAAPGVLGRFVRTELHSLLGAAGAAYGLNAHSTTAIGLGAAYAVAMKLLALASAYVERAAAKDTAYPAAAKLVDDVAAAAGVPELASAPVPPAAAMQAGAP